MGYVISHIVNKTFDNSTQDYSGVRHQQDVMLKKSAVIRFTSLPGPMHGILRNKETFSVDLLENTRSGGKRWGLVFDGVKSILVSYYRLGSKEPNSSKTLYALINFVSYHRIPRSLIK